MSNLSKKLMMGAAGAGGEVLGVEDVFQTWLYTGNGSTQTITNGIDLAGEGGLVWFKARDNAYIGNGLYDTARGRTKAIFSNTTDAEQTYSNDISSFDSTGFSIGDTSGYVNNNTTKYASWTFRKAKKFFDVVTYTGNGTSQNISHSLGSTPGAVIIKATSAAYAWPVWHRSLATNDHLRLNTTDAAFTAASYVSGVSSTTFSVGSGSQVNDSGVSYVAYLFAHDAGGFGDSGNDSIISCGSFAGGDTVTLGWEPQYILWKAYDAVGPWRINDNMRGLPTGGTQSALLANASDAETTNTFFDINPTGFKHLGSGNNYIYIAIRRGPMKAPTDATKVFSANTYTGTSPTAQTVTTGFPIDLIINGLRTQSHLTDVVDRMRGRGAYLYTSSTSSELTSTSTQDLTNLDIQDGYKMGTLTNSDFNKNGENLVSWSFRRAPGFFDVVAYAGTSVSGGGPPQNVNHNLQTAPELIIIKSRSNARSWQVYCASEGNAKRNELTSSAFTSTDYWNSTSPTSSVFTVNTDNDVNGSGFTYIAYLFASCPGVSKVGSYTGTGTTLSIDCGFTAGARFVLIKRTDSTGDWYVWDTARGIIANNDPYLLLNSSAAEVTNTDYIDPLNAGFQISSTAPAAINANGGSFIFLAIA